MATEYLSAFDGIRLAYEKSYVPDSKVAIIVLHGLAEHKGRYGEFLKDLNGLGYTTFALDCRGHGESGGKRGDIKNFDEYISDLDCIVLYIKKNFPNQKIALFGHSLGGLIATIYAAISKNPDMLILSNPLLESPQKSNMLRFLPYKHIGFIKIKKRHSESPEMLQYSYNDPLSCNYFTLRLLGVVFIEGISKFIDTSGTVTLPILILGGKLDPLLDAARLDILSKHLGSDNITVKLYDNARHRLVHSQQKEQVIADISMWIKAANE